MLYKGEYVFFICGFKDYLFIYLVLFFTLSLHSSLQVSVFDSLEIPENFALEMHGQWLRNSDANWKDVVKLVSKFKFALVELADQINRKLIY